MTCTNCGAVEAYRCQCLFADSQCFDVDGRGVPRDPLMLNPVIDPATTNLAECNPSGLGVFLPSYLNDPPSVRVFSSQPQTIPTSTRQVLLFNRERFDTDSMHDPVNDSSRLTFNTAGVYVISLDVQWTGNDTGDRKIGIRMNTAEIIASDERGSEQGDVFDMSLLTIYKFAAGDYVEAIVGQTSGEGLAIVAEGNFSPEFAASYLAVG